VLVRQWRLVRAIGVLLVLTGGTAAAQGNGRTIPTPEIFEALEVAPGMKVCEIGAGDGELSLEAARLVGSEGRVYSSELGEERVGTLRTNVARSGAENVTVLEGDPDGTNLPAAACDALFMRNVYHHFGDPASMNASLVEALRAGARVAVVDFRPTGDEAARPSDRDENGSHGVGAETVSREMQAAGLQPVAERIGEGRWYMLVFAKP